VKLQYEEAVARAMQKKAPSSASSSVAAAAAAAGAGVTLKKVLSLLALLVQKYKY
jgi:hypothetical protein